MRQVRTGCAGWSIPSQYREAFADGDSGLARYASRFPVVEINSSFYRPHQGATYARWAASVPARFRFSVKIPKAISHELALRHAGPALDAFLEPTMELGAKLGGYLLQLPPSQRFEARVASTFLRMFRARTDAPLVLEPRHESWFTCPSYRVLARYAAGLVDADPAPSRLDDAREVAAIWPYWRMHGSPRMYYSAYPDAALHTLAAAVRKRHAPGRPAWVIFDNTAHGFATPDALKFQALVALRARSAG